MMNKMIMAVIPQDEARLVMDQLVIAGHTTTFTTGRGGVLRQAQQMLFIAVTEADLPNVLALIRENCHAHIQIKETVAADEQTTPQDIPATAEVGGAVIFVWDLAHFEVV
jgi:uncharacterized protein YaaQ